MRRSFHPISIFKNEPYSSILGYPKCSKKQIQSRIVELKKLGIKKVSFDGDTAINSIGVLGKGYVGIVILAKMNSKSVALKMRRTDSPRVRMKEEGNLLQIVNQVKVGPKYFASSKNFIVMEFLDGKKIYDWVGEQKGKGSVSRLKNVFKKVLIDCYNLDQIGVDHGELSTLSKHVIIGKNRVSLIDFESSSTNRQVSNVTSATQGIFIGSGIAKNIKKIYKIPSRQSIIKVLRLYKKEKSRENFENVLDVLKL